MTLQVIAPVAVPMPIGVPAQSNIFILMRNNRNTDFTFMVVI
jgi:hypothetical protein